MICPNCDGILNIRGCLSCGWRHGDSWPAHRLVSGSVNPLKPGAEYPTRPGAPVILKNFGKLALVPPIIRAVEPTEKMKAETIIVPDLLSVPVGYIVGDLKDEDGHVTDHVLIGPVPISAEGGGPVQSTEQQATPPGGLPSAAPALSTPEKPIPDPITSTVQ